MSSLRKSARGQECMNCGRLTDTVILAHYSGLRQHSFGKGRGIKGDDYMAAGQCLECHSNGPFSEGYVVPGFEDKPRDVRRVAKSEEQLYQILQWHRSRDDGANRHSTVWRDGNIPKPT